MFGGGNQDGVNVLQKQKILEILELSRRPAVISLIGRDRFLPIHFPEVADGGHLNVMLLLQPGDNPIQLAPATSNSDVPERDAIVGAHDAPIGSRRGPQGGPGQHRGSSI